jgi:hypothetical protein
MTGGFLLRSKTKSRRRSNPFHGGTIVTHHNYANAFFSHDGYIDLLSNDKVAFNELRLAVGA